MKRTNSFSTVHDASTGTVYGVAKRSRREALESEIPEVQTVRGHTDVWSDKAVFLNEKAPS